MLKRFLKGSDASLNDENNKKTSLDIEVRFSQKEFHLKLIISLLVVVIGMLSYAYTAASNDRYAQIDFPPNLIIQAPIKVGNGWANDMYFQVWADWTLNNTATFSPGDVKEKFNNAIRLFSQEKVSSYAGQLGALSNLVLRNQLKQTFTVKKKDVTLYSDLDFSEVTTDPDKVIAAVFTYKGVATQSLGNSNSLPDKSCSYSIALRLEGGHLYQYSFNTDCFK